MLGVHGSDSGENVPPPAGHCFIEFIPITTSGRYGNNEDIIHVEIEYISDCQMVFFVLRTEVEYISERKSH